ncbi:DDE superfamily endonuclease [Popillia japonica]|uniref:DDE superfamily endonuclease n=1 Tax=Popillia japonica TaxID=7064 RepID=A0AAW1MCH9_POPJA
MLERVTSYIISIAKDIITFPVTEDTKAEAALKFAQKQGFPDIVGVIDGTYIPILTPVGKLKSVYCNRHDIPSITLQAICDADKKFIDIFTGASGKIHDARVFKLFPIRDKLPIICGERYHILGDSAYPLREYLLTPYRDYGNLNNREQNFNKKLSGTRVLIENAFGLLKSRFRQLMRVDWHELDKSRDLIEIDDMEQHVLGNAVEEPDEMTLRIRGEAKRDRISAAIL